MDPRKGATVTAPDLVKAFNEGRGIDADSSMMNSAARFYVLFRLKDSEILCRRDFALTELQEMLGTVAMFFAGGGSAVAISVYDDAPDGWDELEEYLPISAG